MYGLKWLFLLMYGSHNMRRTGFPRVVNGPPRSGLHTVSVMSFNNTYTSLHIHWLFMPQKMVFFFHQESSNVLKIELSQESYR